MILDIITQTDFAGAIDETYHCPGAAKLAGLVESVRRQNPEGTLFLDAGDILCGAPICSLTDGEPVVEVCNRLGIDAMTLGNHEFDNGLDTMTRVLSGARFPILCANIVRSGTGEYLPFARPYLMLRRQGIRIAVIGLTTAYTPFMLKAGRFDGLTILPPGQVLSELLPKVRGEGADIVIVLGHLPGTWKDGTLSGELWDTCQAAPGADVMIGGHNVGDIAAVVGNTVFAKAGFSAGSIAHIRLTLDENKQITQRSVCCYDMMNGQPGPEPDPAIQALVDEQMAPYHPRLRETLARIPVRLDVDTWNECALGNFYTGGLAAAGGTDIAFFNATSLFGYMPAGDVTAEMVTHVMCFDEDIYTGQIQGKQLRALFERTYETEHWRLNRGLQFTGLRLTVDTRLPEGRRVCSLALSDGTEIDEEAWYTVATTDYIATGGNDYRGITDTVAWKNTHIRTHAFFVDYLRRLGRLRHETDGRSRNLDPDWERSRTGPR